MNEIYQQTIELNTLYSCVGSNAGNGNTLGAFMEIVGGTANVYGCVNRPANPPEDMAEALDDPFEGLVPFVLIPNFLYVTEASGSIESIILSGVVATEATTA